MLNWKYIYKNQIIQTLKRHIEILGYSEILDPVKYMGTHIQESKCAESNT